MLNRVRPLPGVAMAAGFLFCSLLWPDLATAQEHAGGEQHAEESTQHAAAEKHESHKKNYVALFLGTTQAEREHGKRDDPQFTIGGSYSRHVNRYFGVGVMIDWVAEGDREILAGVPFYVHPWVNPATFVLAPAIDRDRETKDDSFAFRSGFMWEFERGNMLIAPAVYYDFLEGGDVWVIGVELAWGF